MTAKFAFLLLLRHKCQAICVVCFQSMLVKFSLVRSFEWKVNSNLTAIFINYFVTFLNRICFSSFYELFICMTARGKLT